MRNLLVLSVLIALAAASVPGIVARYAAPADGLVGERPNGRQAAKAAGPRRIAIRAGADGHYYVDAAINLRPIRLMVDTGATVVVLRQSDAARVGLRTVRADFSHPVQTANGTTYGAETTLDSVAVSDIDVGDVRALVIPDAQLGMSLLGASFLNRLGRFEVSNGTLILED
ncbi:TIGR02281 family clan AA aspartic protease [Propylenella binzhouense]|uniref:TIGR02281 family clan AA aspartic protease n=1 Tax=Propylenella binzhouense TaxID=2555902 RepID=A0A964WU32_9HYPH|nr:TIGR02281 family clan AA aspartic protease [Propylenella binzhouense]MYZ48682.1 TIGR02281 family clan AA aspartic protease [Propylenella binzhouense]